MKSIVRHVPLVLTAVVLLVGTMLLAAGRLEYCGQPVALRPSVAVAAGAPAGTPTLAPPQKVVVVRVEADKPDVEVGWAEN
jgi:hypothetical protein